MLQEKVINANSLQFEFINASCQIEKLAVDIGEGLANMAFGGRLLARNASNSNYIMPGDLFCQRPIARGQ